MGKLIYLLTTSLDGYSADKDGKIDWSTPSEESHAFVNDQMRNVGTFLFGRKMYQTMKVWDTLKDTDSPAMNDFADIWNAASKVVYSTKLKVVETKKTSLERSFNPKNIQKLVARSNKDFGIGGPHLASEAIKANIIDEYHQLIVPIMLGGGTHWLPKDANNKLELVDLRKFKNGFVHLHYHRMQ